MRATRLSGCSARSVLAVAAAIVAIAGRAAAATPAGSASPTAPAGPSTTVAAPTPEQIQTARDLFAAASRNEDASRWEDALGELERVAELKPTAGVRYHIAFCEEKLGRVASALTHFREAREAAVRDGSKEVLALIDEAFLDTLRARVPALTLQAPRDIPGAIVVLDGHRALPEFLGKAIPLDPGVHHVEASAPGCAPFVRDLVVHEREVTELDVQLVSIPRPSQSTTSIPATIQTPTSMPPVVAPLVATTGALALVGLGITAYVVAGNAQTTGQAECLARAACDDLKTPVRAWDAVALGAWLGGAALAALAVVLWTRSPSSAGETARTQVTVGAPLGLGATGLAIEGTF